MADLLQTLATNFMHGAETLIASVESVVGAFADSLAGDSSVSYTAATAASLQESPQDAPVAVAQTTPQAATTTAVTQTIIEKHQPIVETAPSDGITKADLSSFLVSFKNLLVLLPSSSSGLEVNNPTNVQQQIDALSNEIAQTNRIGQLSGVAISNSTITNTSGAGGASGATALSGLSDVSVSSPAFGHLLEYNGSAWTNVSTSSLGILGASQWVTLGSSVSFTTGNVGIGTTTPGSLLSLQGVANLTTATSSFYSAGGINLTSGCFSINGTCVGGGSSGTVGAGAPGQFAFYSAAGNTLSATSSLFLASSGSVGIGTTTPGSLLTVGGNAAIGSANTVLIGSIAGLSAIQAGGATNASIRIFSAGTGSASFANGDGVLIRGLDGGGAATSWLDVMPGINTISSTTTLTAGGTATNRGFIVTGAGTGTFQTNLPITAAKGVETGNNSLFTWTGSSSLDPTTQAFISGQFMTGTSTSVGSIGGNTINISSDNVNFSGNGTVDGLHIQHNFGGTGEVGGRAGLEADLTQTAADDPSATGFQISHEALIGIARSGVNDGGTSSGYRGVLQGLNTLTLLNSSSTYFGGVYGYEADINVPTGASVADRLGITVNSNGSGDAVQGTLTDAAYGIGQNSANAYPGWRDAFLLGSHASQFPIDPAGTIVGVALQTDRPNGTPSAPYKALGAANGIDLSKVKFTNNAFAAPGFSVNGSGSVVVGNGVISATSTGLAIDVSLYQVTAATVVAGGSGAFVGDKLYAPNGVILTVSSVSGTAVTGLSVDTSGAATSTPSNPIALSGTNAQNVTANLTWSNSMSSLLLDPSGGNIGIGTTTPGSIFSVAGVANWTAATSTFYSSGGINLTSGCFSINGICVGNAPGYAFSYPLTSVANTVSLSFGTSTANVWGSLQTFSSGFITSASSTVVGALTASGSFNTPSATGGYQVDGTLVLQASSTNSSTLVGFSAGASLLASTNSCREHGVRLSIAGERHFVLL